MENEVMKEFSHVSQVENEGQMPPSVLRIQTTSQVKDLRTVEDKSVLRQLSNLLSVKNQ